MSTTSGDIANYQDGLGGEGINGNMKDYLKGINKINDERTKRYKDLTSKGGVRFPERSNIVKRVNPKK